MSSSLYELLTSVGDGCHFQLVICRLDNPNQPIYANDAFCKEMGVTNEALASFSFQDLHGPLTSQKDRESFRKHLIKGEPFYQDIVNYKGNGQPFFNRCLILFFNKNLVMGLQINMGDPDATGSLPAFPHSSAKIGDRIFNALHLMTLASCLDSEGSKALIGKKIEFIRDFVKGI